MAWTKEQAEKKAAEQNDMLARRGAFQIVMDVQYHSEEYGWLVYGRFAIDGEKDPTWAPILKALK